MTKLPVLLTIVVAVALLIGLMQHQELRNLQARGDELQQSPALAQARLATSATAGRPAAEKSSQSPEAHPSQPASRDALAATAFLRKAEDLIINHTQIEAAVQLTPILALASRGMLKEILAQLSSTKLDKDSKAMAWKMILLKLVKKEPLESVEMSLRSGYPWVFGEIFGKWIERDPTTAEAWYEQQLTSGEFPTEPEWLSIQAEAQMVKLIAKRDPVAAFDRISATGGEEKSKQRKMLDYLKGSITNADDWLATVQRATQLEQQTWLRQIAISTYLAPMTFSHGTPEEQIARIDQLELKPNERSWFAQAALNRHALRSSPEQREWAFASLEPSSYQTYAGGFFKSWLKADPQNAQVALDALPDGELRDAVTAKLAE